jgi:hypothetical protein
MNLINRREFVEELPVAMSNKEIINQNQGLENLKEVNL